MINFNKLRIYRIPSITHNDCHQVLSHTQALSLKNTPNLHIKIEL
jgi:hypothetical protein